MSTYSRHVCRCHECWPISPLWERAADWFMAPLNWAADLPTPKQRLGGILLVLPISFLVLPAFLLMIAGEISERLRAA